MQTTVLSPHRVQCRAQRQHPASLPHNLHPLIPFPENSLEIPRHRAGILGWKHDGTDWDERPIFQGSGQDPIFLGEEEGSQEGRRVRVSAGGQDAGGEKKVSAPSTDTSAEEDLHIDLKECIEDEDALLGQIGLPKG